MLKYWKTRLEEKKTGETALSKELPASVSKISWTLPILKCYSKQLNHIRQTTAE